ncbi:polysaccharide deacetylase family protein [Geodermatophilus amargosae]|uniref:polysaccharide deacetylase family protein n=1 Tax=Geodermatophilus amargosae TaxID=1296565 RepID=UPI0034DE5885
MNALTSARTAAVATRRTARRTAGTLLGSAVELRTPRPEVVLTFDDGPEPGGTDQVLTALASAGASATFFVLLTRVRRHRALLDEVLAAGHEVALHGVDHRALPSLPPDEVARLVRAGRAELEDATGRPVRWFRPPYGRQTFRNWRAVTAAGMVPVLWGPTTWDWKDVTVAERVAKAQQGIRPGAIVLAHDGFAGPADGACDGPPPVLHRGELIAGVLEGYAGRGLAARSLEHALDAGELVRETWFPG